MLAENNYFKTKLYLGIKIIFAFQVLFASPSSTQSDLF